MKNTEYEKLIDERKRVVNFIREVTNDTERAEAEAKAGREWISRAKKRLAEIEARMEEIRGT